MVTLDVTAEETVFRNEDNGYTVLLVKEGRNRFSAVGCMPEVSEGERITLTGEWVEHPVYGKQIKVSGIEFKKPETTDAIERYLASGIIRGIGPATAKQIVDAFGKDALDIMAEDPERLVELSGIGPKRAKMIAESYAEHFQQREVMLFLQQYQISPLLATKIYKKYGDDVRNILLSNPYRLVDDIEGIGFKTADRIASSIGVDASSEYRLSAGIRYVLNVAGNNGGHCYVPRPLLTKECAEILGADEQLIETTIDTLVLNHLVKAEIVGDGDEETIAIYDNRCWKAEQEAARLLLDLHRAGIYSAIPEQNEVDDVISRIEREEGMTLHDIQKQAVCTATREPVTVITGGPGTGKTTIIKCILEILGDEEEVALAAPTGRAAKRMTEACGCEAKTIHRMLEYGGEEGVFQRDSSNQLEFNTVIIDEMSMVDIFLMRNLLNAIRAGTRLILVGDADQLPSVGVGNVLKDILNSGVIPSVTLSEIFRQSNDSMIVYNAHRINNGLPPRLNSKGGDFFFERAASSPVAIQKILELVSERIPSFLKLENPVQDIQVLSPMKKGDCGVWVLNRKLQECLNPPAHGKKERLWKETVFRVGDKVMQTRNNYSLAWRREGVLEWEEGEGIFNGDIGFITEIDPELPSVKVVFDDDREVIYEDQDLDDLELAYCISIHKSQGSEFPVVVIPVIGGAPLLMSRNLLYTAVTRAKKMVMLVGRETVIDQMIRNNNTRKRYTALDWRLKRLDAPISL